MTRPRRGPAALRTAIPAVCVLFVALAALSGAATADGLGATPADGAGAPAAIGPTVSAVDGPAPALADASGGPAAAEQRATVAQAVDADRTRLTVALRPDGDAVWTVELRVQLQDEDARQAFESLQDDVESDPENFTESYRERMSGAVDAASSATGREMAVENVTVSATIDEFQDDGVLTYEFRWTNFAATDGDRLRAGDAVDGFFLEEGTRLTIRWPEGYRPVSVSPTPDDESASRATWRGGETEFAAGEPRVVVEPDGGPPLRLLALGGLVLLLAGGAWLVATGRVALPGGSGVRDGPAAAAESGAAAGAAGGGDPTAGSADGGAGQGGDAGASAGAAGVESDGAPAADDGADEEEIPSELLSNEEQVLRLLEANGGRMKQQQVVSELEWTEAKTSQVVTSMHDEETIEKFRIGRENVLALPEEADL